MRSLIVVAAIASLTAGTAFAQDAKEPTNPPAAQTQPTAPSAAISETQAKERMEAQGFTNVSELKKDAQGMWNAKAVKDGKAVQLSLDARGQVTQRN